MDKDQYKNFTAEDFILDDDIRKIVMGSDSGRLLGELMAALPEKNEQIHLAVKILRGMSSNEVLQDDQRKQALWREIVQQHKRRIRFIYLRYAASILFLITVGGGIFFHFNQNPTDSIVITKENKSADAMLILADGKKVAISTKQSTVQFSADGSGILVNDSSDIAQSDAVVGFNQLIVPFGKRSYILLSDGTKVWLNSGSTLTFPSVFKGKSRDVTLVGEAFFEVAKNTQVPFYVSTEGFKMKVYGTKFNVQAYQQDPDFYIVLIEGKVGVKVNDDLQAKEVFLAPNQRASLAKGEKTFEISNIDNVEIYTAWVDGYLAFKNEDLANLLKRVSRYYNAEIEVEITENIETIYGKLDLKDDLERVLDGISLISKTKYAKEGSKYIFRSN